MLPACISKVLPALIPGNLANSRGEMTYNSRQPRSNRPSRHFVCSLAVPAAKRGPGITQVAASRVFSQSARITQDELFAKLTELAGDRLRIAQRRVTPDVTVLLFY
jgi:hypothetical protein